MTGVSIRYPQWDPKTQGLINLEGRINRCRVDHQNMPALAYESDELLALSALIAWTSRSRNVVRDFPPELWPALQRGQKHYETRRGQSNLACMHCHTFHAGQRLAGETLSQGQPLGYPAYRLEWQKMGSLHRRLRACLSGVRAKIEPFGSEFLMELELYLNYRAQGLSMEAPAVRR
jgi:sulfur-oxidizing protein SoxA